MSIKRVLDLEAVKDFKLLTQGGNELMWNIRGACANYALGGMGTMLAIHGLEDGNPKTVACATIGIIANIVWARYFRKKAQAQIRKDYRER